MAHIKSLARAAVASLPLACDERADALAIIDGLPEQYQYRAIIGRTLRERLRPCGPEALDAYDRFAARFPGQSPFSWIPASQHFAGLLRVATLVLPNAPMHRALNALVGANAPEALSQMPSLKAMLKASDGNIQQFLRNLGSSIRTYQNFGFVEVLHAHQHHVQVVYDDVYSPLVNYIDAPYLRALLRGLLHIPAEVTTDEVLPTSVVLSFRW